MSKLLLLVFAALGRALGKAEHRQMDTAKCIISLLREAMLSVKIRDHFLFYAKNLLRPGPGGAAPIKSGVASSRMDFLRDPYCVGCAGDIYPQSTHFLPTIGFFFHTHSTH